MEDRIYNCRFCNLKSNQIDEYKVPNKEFPDGLDIYYCVNCISGFVVIDSIGDTKERIDVASAYIKEFDLNPKPIGESISSS